MMKVVFNGRMYWKQMVGFWSNSSQLLGSLGIWIGLKEHYFPAILQPRSYISRRSRSSRVYTHD